MLSFPFCPNTDFALACISVCITFIGSLFIAIPNIMKILKNAQSTTIYGLKTFKAQTNNHNNTSLPYLPIHLISLVCFMLSSGVQLYKGWWIFQFFGLLGYSVGSDTVTQPSKHGFCVSHLNVSCTRIIWTSSIAVVLKLW